MDKYTEAENRLEVTDFLEVGDGHKLALYRHGNPEGETVLVLHGGPGGKITAKSLSFFDLFKFDVIAFDQRGCGESTPFASLEKNDINYLVSDIEKIREHYGIEKWSLFGGSFGTTLAMSYAIAHPERVKGMVLRGVFLGRQEDIDWLYQEGASYFYPENFARYRDFLPADRHDDIVQAYYEIFSGDDEEKIKEASLHWANWEMGLVRLKPHPVNFQAKAKAKDISLAKLECHYFANNLGWDEGNYILDHTPQIEDIKTIIVHGRYDVDCRPSGAFELKAKLKNADIFFPLAGHGANDLDYNEALIKAANELLSKGRFIEFTAEHKAFAKLKKWDKSEIKESELLEFVEDGTALAEVQEEDTIIVNDLGTGDRLRIKVRELKKSENETLFIWGKDN
ncbi:MAG: prolyl aminopeptidase [Eubacteriales bacterium]|nr:prolyl aminopeptidase [Eubacteriales bacterium]